ncbi:MAG: mechanosensitive ion channel family protein [Bdellovibrionaceae bacterium]|nr:mechanosensitive ion channel family protein [Pseudobdellovibrionaceae bacterium]NUM60425.1 mechanosensitive ion channel family protein [Pseudobdellovibrionaceae bacterium]
MNEKFIQTQNLYGLLEIEPYILLGVLMCVTWLFYKFFLKAANEDRHRNIQNHFKNIVRNFIILSLLFFFFLLLNESNLPINSIKRITPYLGLATLISGMIVFVKTCRLIVLQYLFMSSMQTGVPLLIVNIFSLLLSIVLIFWTASHVFSIQLGPLLATSAAFSIILGLALQDTLGNLFAGISLQIDKSFEIDDWLEIVSGTQKVTGKVKEITWRSTILQGWFDEVITLPNRWMAQAQISNFSPNDNPVVRSVIFKVEHGADPDKVIQILENSIAGLSDIKGIPSPFCYVSDAAENSISFKLVFFLDDYGSQYIVGDKIYRKGFQDLQKNGIRLARPYIEVNSLN